MAGREYLEKRIAKSFESKILRSCVKRQRS